MSKPDDEETVDIPQRFTNAVGERIVHRIPKWMAEMMRKKKKPPKQDDDEDLVQRVKGQGVVVVRTLDEALDDE